MNNLEKIEKWGTIWDVKKTGLNSNGLRICPVCEKDSGQSPIRIDFTNVDVSVYFHKDCAVQLKNKSNTFFQDLP